MALDGLQDGPYKSQTPENCNGWTGVTALTIVTEAKRCDEGLRGSCSFSFGKEPVYVGGKDLTVAEVSGSFELRAAPASSGDAEVAQIVVEFGYSSSSEPSHRYASASVSTLPPPPRLIVVWPCCTRQEARPAYCTGPGTFSAAQQ